MENKSSFKAILVPVLICLIFIFSIIGYKQLLGNEFSLAGVIYSTLTFFALESMKPEEVTSNIYLLVAKYLAALLLGFGIYSLVYHYLSRQYRVLKIKFGYRKHIVVFSLKMVGPGFISDLLLNNYKVILVEENAENPYLEKIKKDGVIIFNDKDYDSKLFDSLLISNAGTCIVAFDDDSLNIDLSMKLIKYLIDTGHKHNVKVLTHIENRSNLEVIRDYLDTGNSDHNFSFEVFNVFSAAAKKIYDQYPPHEYFNFNDNTDENAIAVIGYNAAAEDFVLENLVLSHYKDCGNIKVYIVDKDADGVVHNFMYQYPYYKEFIDIVPVKLLNNKFFANFNWSKELIEKLSKVKVAYFFGDKGAELISLSWRFRQFISGQSLNYVQTPVIVCFPEDTVIMKLHDTESGNKQEHINALNNRFNIHYVNLITDTCTSARLIEHSEYIDLLSRIINYYYSIKYEFEDIINETWHIADAHRLNQSVEDKLLNLSEQQTALTENDVEQFVLEKIAEIIKKPLMELMPYLSVKSRWDSLTYHKKSANRYAARHFAVKINIMKNIGCLPLNRENILNSFPVIAPIEHKRWSAEKMVLNYRYGVLPKDKIARNAAKEVLKIHDQLIPYNKLTQIEKEKDLNIFLLMPLLHLLKAEIKK